MIPKSLIYFFVFIVFLPNKLLQTPLFNIMYLIYLSKYKKINEIEMEKFVSLFFLYSSNFLIEFNFFSLTENIVQLKVNFSFELFLFRIELIL